MTAEADVFQKRNTSIGYKKIARTIKCNINQICLFLKHLSPESLEFGDYETNNLNEIFRDCRVERGV